MTNKLPNDAMLCLSVVNTKLRDIYSDLDALCEDINIEKEVLVQKMRSIDYEYDYETNQFI